MLKFYVEVYYVMGKALSGELSCPCDRPCCYSVCVSFSLFMGPLIFGFTFYHVPAMKWWKGI